MVNIDMSSKQNYEYSVLMSVYANDRVDYLELAIDSMLNQTVPPEQYVIVIDGPVGNDIEQLIETYIRKRPDLFTLVKLKTNGGLANALNHGLKVCRNDLVARMDADDISKPNRCEKELNEFRNNPDLAVCGCYIEEFYGDKENIKTIRMVPSTYEKILKFGRRRQPVNHPSVIYKKEAVMADLFRGMMTLILG